MRDLVRVSLVVLTFLASASCDPDRTTPADDDSPAGSLPGLDVDSLRRASRSTNSPFVLVTIVDADAGRERVAAVSFGALETAVSLEHGRSAADTVLRSTRRFEFRDPKALQNAWPRYSVSELAEARTLLVGRSTEQIVADQGDLTSDLNTLSRQKLGEPYGYMRCVIHVLLERGVACGAACEPGLVYLHDPERQER